MCRGIHKFVLNLKKNSRNIKNLFCFIILVKFYKSKNNRVKSTLILQSSKLILKVVHPCKCV